METFAKRVVHIGSTSSTFAALIRFKSLSAFVLGSASYNTGAAAVVGTYSNFNIVISEDESRIGCCKLRVRHCEVVYL